MKETLKLGLYLLLVCAVAALALAGTDVVTRDRIRAAKEAAERASLSEALPAASTFETREGFIEGLTSDGRTAGYVLKIFAPGYSSRIEALVGIDTEFRVTGLKILFQNETPGLGTKITAPSFTAPFAGRAPEEIRLKKDGGSLDAITAATISSRAITDAVRKGIDVFRAARAAGNDTGTAPVLKDTAAAGATGETR